MNNRRRPSFEQVFSKQREALFITLVASLLVDRSAIFSLVASLLRSLSDFHTRRFDPRRSLNIVHYSSLRSSPFAPRRSLSTNHYSSLFNQLLKAFRFTRLFAGIDFVSLQNVSRSLLFIFVQLLNMRC